MQAVNYFSSRDKVDLYGDTACLVWKHNTLYCLTDPMEKGESKNKKCRAWVNWRYNGEENVQGVVAVILKAKDWKRNATKLRLQAQPVKTELNEGWRTFQVTPYKKDSEASAEEIKEQNKPVKIVEVTHHKSDAKDHSVLQRIEKLEKRVNELEQELKAERKLNVQWRLSKEQELYPPFPDNLPPEISDDLWDFSLKTGSEALI